MPHTPDDCPAQSAAATPTHRITSLAAWSPDIARRLLSDEERDGLVRYLWAIAREQEQAAEVTPPLTTPATHE